MQTLSSSSLKPALSCSRLTVALRLPAICSYRNRGYIYTTTAAKADGNACGACVKWRAGQGKAPHPSLPSLRQGEALTCSAPPSPGLICSARAARRAGVEPTAVLAARSSMV
jgi:hypothetical protein